MQEMKKAQSPIAWVLGQTGDHGGQYVLSVVLAIIGVAFSLAPYFVVIGIVQGLMDGVKDFSFYLSRCLIMAALWLGRVLFHALSTATSHKATFAVLGEIRKRCMEKLTRLPLGAVLEQSSGALKNTLIERIDSIETTLAHIVPEFTANLLIPVLILIYIFTVDRRMGLASLATVPLGMFCYMFMMAGSAKFYQRTVTATKALNDTAVEYIGGIQVIKVFGKTKSSYERFVHDAYEAAHSFIDWMRASILPFTFAMVIMPATMVSVLLTGMGPWPLLTCAVAGLLSELCFKSGAYKSVKKAVLSYGLFSMWIFGNYLPLFTDYEGYFAQRADYGQAYIDAVQKLMPLWMAPVLLIACFVCGLLGGLLGRTLLKKHFEKAGLA